MTALQIILLVVGLLLIVGSFFFSEKLSSSDLDEIQKVSEQEIKVIIEKEINKANSDIEERVQTILDEKAEDFERRTDKETNEKLLSIGEYSDTILSSMNKSHDEILFMYEMLNEKNAKITELTQQLQQMESELVQMKDIVASQLVEVQNMTEVEVSVPEEDLPPEESVSENVISQFAESNLVAKDQDNTEIINLYKKGLPEIEIAKKLGRGLGEVKLVLGLFSEGKKDEA